MEAENVSLLNKRKQSCCIRHFSNGCVCTKGVILLLVWSAVIESSGYFIFLETLNDLNHLVPVDYTFALSVSSVKYIGYLLYPFAGLAAETYWSRYRVMIVGTVLAFIGIMIATPSIGIATYTAHDNCTIGSDAHNCIQGSASLFALIPGFSGMAIYRIGLGLFEANVIQFGSDQLLFASSEKLSVFVSWYFWSMYTMLLAVYYTCDLLYFPLHFNTKFQPHTVQLILSSVITLVSVLLFMFLLILWWMWRHHLKTDPDRHINPVKHIYSVLKFVKSHNQPLMRSALTYGEFPTRMDYAKQRYGGPFTTEQVEDVKTFGRILLVIVTLSGSLLISSTSSVSIYSTLYLQYLVIVMYIPVHLLFFRTCLHRWTTKITILQKIGFGLFLAFVQNLLMIVYSYNSSSQAHTILIIMTALFHGFSTILVFLSVLQFILAQAPRNMQGLLIGMWYAYWSVTIIFQILLKYSLNSNHHYSLYTICSSIVSFLSLMLFLLVSANYCYRQREEPADINRQRIAEEYTERHLSRRRNIQQQLLSTDSESYEVEMVWD